MIPTSPPSAVPAPHDLGLRARWWDVRQALSPLPPLPPELVPPVSVASALPGGPFAQARGRLATGWSYGRQALAVLHHLLRRPRPRRTNAIGRTDLMLASLAGHTVRVRLLLRTADPLQADAMGRTALMHAARKERLNAVRALLPVSDPNQQSRQGLTALGLAMVRNESGLTMVSTPAILGLLAPRTDLRHTEHGLSLFVRLLLTGPKTVAMQVAARSSPADALPHPEVLPGIASPATTDGLILQIVEHGNWPLLATLVHAWPSAQTRTVLTTLLHRPGAPEALRQVLSEAQDRWVREEQAVLMAMVGDAPVMPSRPRARL